MLPQGDFQAFLRAGGRDRQRILETLFGTQRFQAVERWLVEHRRVQARRCREQEERLGRL
ncbi:MAG: repair protein SbcC/Rad50, partial [Nocardioidaceae bacterium]|nr:repair protein SbcC/Rad50 [Nocardioidaceae bacterium]